METGYILKGVGGFYTVLTNQNEQVVCKARGKFRKQGLTPVCGDRVEFARQQEGEAAITNILPRRSLLQRPPVANIDQLMIVLCVEQPKADLLLCDKLLLACAQHHIEPCILVNKCDTPEARTLAATICGQYAPHYKTLAVSAKTGYRLDALSGALDGHITCFTGQSAVGKSSLLNALLPSLALPVGGLAKRTDRGRHTTRHAQLWPYKTGAVLDTAGFSLLDAPLIEQEALNAAYREFGDAPARCRFFSCTHRSEPDCAVKPLIASGALHKERYERYVVLSEQFEEMRKHQYD